MSHSLATVQYKPTDIGTERLGAILVKSGFFKDTRDEAQAIVKVLYGGEQGFGPIASMLGVYIVNGRPSLSAQMIAAAIQKSGVFKYRVREWTDKLCRVEFLEGHESIGVSEFSLEDAQRAGLLSNETWKKYPKAMLWARAMSQGARAFCPAVFHGAIYTPEELGATVTDEGNVVDVGTGEMLQERYVPTDEQTPDDRDMVRSADDPWWQRWLTLLGKAQDVGINPQKLTLPVDRNELKEYGKQVADEITRRQREAAAVGTRQ
jgi:hypothetical protein